jgi:hypothetical protein
VPIHPNFDPMFNALAADGRIDIRPGCQSLLGCNRAAEVVLCNDVSTLSASAAVQVVSNLLSIETIHHQPQQAIPSYIHG